MKPYLLCIDQGTTSSRSLIFNTKGEVIACAQEEFTQHYPQSGWVEHNPEDIWQSTLNCLKQVLAKAKISAHDIASLGITNQRETTLVWHKKTGQCIYPAIVWQDRRTHDYCTQLKQDPSLQADIQKRTGLLLDPYFSATKIRWILDHIPHAQALAEQGELLFGTVDSFLLWRLTNKQVHATDATNASRTLLFNIHSQSWDSDLLARFNIPLCMLPKVQDSMANFGVVQPEILGAAIQIGALIGDQQSALVGHGCVHQGETKTTYGTGCFLMANTGVKPIFSTHKLLTTVAYRLDGQAHYAVEGSIFMAGATMQWLRDGLNLIAQVADSEQLAQQTGYDNPVHIVPAFTGLGAPYWNPQARGAILGLTRDTGIKEIVTAGLQAVCYQTLDLVRAIEQDGMSIKGMKIDGGMVANRWLVQFLTDLLGVPIERANMPEVTAWGAAFLAGLQVGVFSSLSEVCLHSCCESFLPQISNTHRQRLYADWLAALKCIHS